MEFESFPKIPRLNREIIITEKIDGTNAQVVVGEDGTVRAGSRNQWISPASDNHGFAAWVEQHSDELRDLGPGRHFGEWWGRGINKRYGDYAPPQKRFALFNVTRWGTPWGEARPACCDVVPTLYRGRYSQAAIDEALNVLLFGGSVAAPGCMRPEGIIVFHTAAKTGFKVTLERDDEWKGKAA